jgi:ABC-2 type transport system permease protein
MPAPATPGLLSVAAREVAWIWHDRVALLLVAAIPHCSLRLKEGWQW